MQVGRKKLKVYDTESSIKGEFAKSRGRVNEGEKSHKTDRIQHRWGPGRRLGNKGKGYIRDFARSGRRDILNGRVCLRERKAESRMRLKGGP